MPYLLPSTWEGEGEGQAGKGLSLGRPFLLRGASCHGDKAFWSFSYQPKEDG